LAEIHPEVTCVINTKDRYFSTLPLALTAICQQTLLPARLIIFDDGEHRDLRGDPLYSHIFGLLNHRLGGRWEVVFAARLGQVANHIKSLSMATTEWLWRIDDDNVPEPDVLEKLVRSIKPNVGAIGGLVINGNGIQPLPATASNKIEDIYLGKNEQWYLHPAGQQPYEVDHLYSSFLYRRSIAEYCEELSVVGHREETIMTYGLKRKGYVNIIDPSAITWHFCNSQGGLRAHDPRENFAHDERVFSRYMKDWGIGNPTEHSYVVLDNGLGDHYAFKYWLPAYFEKNQSKKHFFYVCFPEVFEGVPNITLGSIADAKNTLGNIDRYNIYMWMIDRRWTQGLCAAFNRLYQIPPLRVNPPEPRLGYGSTIIISPYSFQPDHPKSYPFWDQLIPLLRAKYPTSQLIQIGRKDEPHLIAVDDHLMGLPLRKIQELITGCRFWISGDNFLQHMVNAAVEQVRGVVLWGVSDPKLFGYGYNLNILRGTQYLRPDQFGVWPGFPKNNDVFERPEIVIERIVNSYGTR